MHNDCGPRGGVATACLRRNCAEHCSDPSVHSSALIPASTSALSASKAAISSRIFGFASEDVADFATVAHSV